MSGEQLSFQTTIGADGAALLVWRVAKSSILLIRKSFAVAMWTSVVVAGTASCTSSEGLSATSQLGAMLAAESASLDQIGMPGSVSEAMPTKKDASKEELALSPDNAYDVASAHLVVIGKVVAVSPSLAFTFADDGTVGEVPFGSSEVLWQYVRVTIAIDEVVASVDGDFAGTEVDVLMISPQSESLEFSERAYSGLGRAVFFLVPDGTADDAPYRPLGSLGDWIFTVDSNGSPTGAPLAIESQRQQNVLDALQNELMQARGGKD